MPSTRIDLLRRRLPAAITLTATLVCVAGRANAQNTAADRARRAIQDAATAGQKAVTGAASSEVNSAVQNVATENVADGSFSAVFSPWSSSDGSKRVELARYSGAAYALVTASGRQVVLCDNRGLIPWQVTFAIQNAAPAAAAARGGTPGRGAAGRGTPPAAPPHAPAAAPDSTGRGSVVSAVQQAPSAARAEYHFPSTTVTITFPTTGAKSGVPGGGSLFVAEVSQNIFAGEAKVRYLQATIPGDTKRDVVDFGAAFKARVLPATQSAGGCAALAHASAGLQVAGTPGRGGATTTDSQGARGARSGGTTGPVVPPAAVVATGPVFTAGDVLAPKIDSIRLRAESNDTAKVISTLKKTDELVYLGDELNGFVHVQGSGGEGWIRKVLVVKLR